MLETIMTVILMGIFMIILEKYGPYALYIVVDRYLATVCQNEPFVPWKVVPSLPNIHSSFDRIQGECRGISSELEMVPPMQNVDPSQRLVTQDDGWKAYMIYVHGRPVPQNIHRVPETAAAIRRVEGVWNAFFSFLAPGKKIPTNKSMTRGLLRYHLGVIIPEGECSLFVKDRKYDYKENQGALFDPTYPNAILNNTDGYRVVLFLDIIRPMQGFAHAVNKLALGMAAKHKAVDHAIYHATVRPKPVEQEMPEQQETTSTNDKKSKSRFTNL